MKTKIIIIAILITANAIAQKKESAKITDDSPLIWWNAGIGGSRNVFSHGFSFSILQSKNLFSLRYAKNKEEQPASILGGVVANPNESVYDIGFLYGRIVKGKYAFASVSAGLGFVQGIKRGKAIGSITTGGGGAGWFSFGATTYNYETIPYSTIGIPLECQIFLTPASWFGIGIYGFANINSKNSFGAAMLCLQIGQLR